MVRKAVDNFDLTRWRETPADVVLRALSDHAKLDVDYRPRLNNSSSRWHVVAQGAHFEILCTGPKFLDTRAGRGWWSCRSCDAFIGSRLQIGGCSASQAGPLMHLISATADLVIAGRPRPGFSARTTRWCDR
jgi:hypothetical protein